MANTVGNEAPKLLVPDFVLAAALPGAANWSQEVPDGSLGHGEMRLIELCAVTDCTITAHRVPVGGTAVAANRFLAALPLTAGTKEDIYWDPRMALWPAGYSLYIFANTGTCNCAIHGVIVT